MKPSEYLKSQGLELTAEQVAAVDESMKVKGQKRADKKFQVADKSKIGEIKTAQKKLVAVAITRAKGPVDMNEWAELATAEGLVTKQDPARIVAYYRKDLVEAGIVKEA